MRHHPRRRRLAARAAAITGCATLLSGIAAVGAATPGSASAGQPPARASAAARSEAATGCRLGNGVKHVVELTFDNVHFFRDNPNVPSDLQMMPNLLNFLQGNGTFLSNNHTPLIAHTADDLLTTFTGLYGDRHGMPISNSYRTYNPDGSTDPAGSFAYWTDPVFNTASTPEPRPRHQPVAGLLGDPARHDHARPDAGHHHPGPVGAVHPGRVQRG